MLWDKVCGNCNKEFQAKTINIKYCSIACREEIKRKNNVMYVKSWHKNNRERSNEIARNCRKRKNERIIQLQEENKKLRKQLQDEAKDK